MATLVTWAWLASDLHKARTDRDVEEVHPRQPQQQLPLVPLSVGS